MSDTVKIYLPEEENSNGTCPIGNDDSLIDILRQVMDHMYAARTSNVTMGLLPTPVWTVHQLSGFVITAGRGCDGNVLDKKQNARKELKKQCVLMEDGFPVISIHTREQWEFGKTPLEDVNFLLKTAVRLSPDDSSLRSTALNKADFDLWIRQNKVANLEKYKITGCMKDKDMVPIEHKGEFSAYIKLYGKVSAWQSLFRHLEDSNLPEELFMPIFQFGVTEFYGVLLRDIDEEFLSEFSRISKECASMASTKKSNLTRYWYKHPINQLVLKEFLNQNSDVLEWVLNGSSERRENWSQVITDLAKPEALPVPSVAGKYPMKAAKSLKRLREPEEEEEEEPENPYENVDDLENIDLGDDLESSTKMIKIVDADDTRSPDQLFSDSNRPVSPVTGTEIEPLVI